MTLSTPGLIGAALGLVASSAMYFVTMFMLKRPAPDTTVTADERERAAASVRTVLLADIPILTALGYYAGQLYG